MGADEIVHHLEEARPAATAPQDPALIAENARLATEEEHSMTFWQAAKRYKKACFWSAVVSLTIIMDGYDTALLGSLQAFPSFQSRFGHRVGDTSQYQLSAPWQVALGVSNSVGNIFGIYINSVLTERFGHKRALLGTLFVLTGIIFVPFFATSIRMLFAGEILCGLCWGVFTTLAPAYASEVCPVVLRSYLETFVVLCWGIGQFVSFGVLAALSNRESDPWAWRIPIAVQWVWPLLIIPLVFFAPESPWWLVRKDRVEAAERQVMRLSSADRDEARRTVALMIHTNGLEKALGEGTSVWDCFRGPNLVRTEIACVTYVSQQLCGFVISGYATYFYEQAGLPASQAFHMSVGQAGLHFVCTLAAFPLTGRVGRRPLLFWGEVGMALLMLLIGFASLAPNSTGQGYGESAVYLLWYAVYELTMGPGAYIVVSEVSSTRLRSMTIGLARICYNVASVVNSVVGPYILNPTYGDWKGKCGFLTGGIIVVCAVWTWFRLPEMRGRTYEELDILFAKGVGARDFAHQPADLAALEREEKE